MPQLSELIGKRKFIKKEYRPWDLSGTGTIDGKEKSSPAENVARPEQPTTQSRSIPDHNIPKIPDIKTKSGNKTGNVLGNKWVTNGKQTDNKQVTETTHLGNNQVTIGEQLDNDTGNVLGNISGNIERLAYLVNSMKKLSGIQKEILQYVINLCTARGTLETGNILSIDLANAANCSIGSAKTSLIRLLEKNLILRFPGKCSRGGHMVLGITKDIQAAAIQAQQAFINPLKKAQTGNVTGNVMGNINLYSSSIYNTTTTDLPNEWKQIDFEHLRHIGFSETQLRQLHDSNATTPEIVQDAIQRFAYSLLHNSKVKAYSDPLNVLMGVLRKGQRWVEPNYISPNALALRQMLEEKRKQKEDFEAMLKELTELEFPEWRKGLSDGQMKEIVPADIRKTNLSAAIEASLRIYFTENLLLPRLKKQGIDVERG